MNGQNPLQTHNQKQWQWEKFGGVGKFWNYFSLMQHLLNTFEDIDLKASEVDVLNVL